MQTRSPYLERAGRQVDVSLNVICLNGEEDETISEHAAKDSKAGERWACVLCSLLSILVERDHCGKVLSNAPEGNLAFIRAGVAILGFLIGLDGIAHLAFDAATVAAGSIAAIL